MNPHTPRLRRVAAVVLTAWLLLAPAGLTGITARLAAAARRRWHHLRAGGDRGLATVEIAILAAVLLGLATALLAVIAAVVNKYKAEIK